MRKHFTAAAEAARLRRGPAGTRTGDRYGVFVFKDWTGGELGVIASNGDVEGAGNGWDHVSVSLKNRCPAWDEMKFVKEQFFDPEELAVQFHPPESRYVNNHPYVLHIWRPIRFGIPLPPPELV